MPGGADRAPRRASRCAGSGRPRPPRSPAAPRTRGRTCAGCAPRARAPSAPRRGRSTQRELGLDLGARRRLVAGAGELGEDPGLPSEPRAIITASAPDSLEARRAPPRAVRAPPETITGISSSADELGDQRVVGLPAVAGRRRARVEARSRRPRPRPRAGGRDRGPTRSPGSTPERSFTVTGSPEPSAAARATATARSGSRSSAAPAPVLTHLRHRAAHVQVDQVGARLGGGRRRHRASRSGSWPKSWIETGCSSGWIRSISAQRALVAVARSRSSRPSPRPPARRRGGAPAGGRTSCRSRPAGRAGPGWGSRPPPIRSGAVSGGSGPAALTGCAPRSAAARSGSAGRRPRRSSRSRGRSPRPGRRWRAASARRRARRRSGARSRRSAPRSRR